MSHENPAPDKPLLYLIGVSHAVQFKSEWAQMGLGEESERVQATREAFKTHVAAMINKHNIEVLAEEFSRTAKKKWGVSKTELEQISNEDKGINHRLCDPEGDEKEALGIEVDPNKETESDWRKREQFWLSRIVDCKDRRVLFVCGRNHTNAFEELLESNGFNVQRGQHFPDDSISDREFISC